MYIHSLGILNLKIEFLYVQRTQSPTPSAYLITYIIVIFHEWWDDADNDDDNAFFPPIFPPRKIEE